MSVADVGTANGAAASLHRTQAAVSMQIRRLEEAVGAQLFDRSANGLTLAAGGLLLRPYARQILSFSDELKHRIGDYRVEGRVKLGVVQDFAATRLIQILKAFHDQNPLVQIDLIVSSAEPLPLILFEGSCPWRNRVIEALSDRNARGNLVCDGSTLIAMVTPVQVGIGIGPMIAPAIPLAAETSTGRATSRLRWTSISGCAPARRRRRRRVTLPILLFDRLVRFFPALRELT